LEKLIQDAEYSLSHFSLPIPDDIGAASTDIKLILDELSFDTNFLSSSTEDDIHRLNNCQNNVFDAICCSLLNNEGKTFFVYGYGGIGKTFLWTT
jgi:ATP-dependent DNA helicase PIF1